MKVDINKAQNLQEFKEVITLLVKTIAIDLSERNDVELCRKETLSA